MGARDHGVHLGAGRSPTCHARKGEPGHSARYRHAANNPRQDVVILGREPSGEPNQGFAEDGNEGDVGAEWAGEEKSSDWSEEFHTDIDTAVVTSRGTQTVLCVSSVLRIYVPLYLMCQLFAVCFL